MTAPIGAIASGVLKARRRPLTLWAVSIAAVAALYTAFYPSIGGDKMEVMLQSMPPELITAMGFDSITTAAGYVSSTVYSLLGAILTLVCAIGLGAGLIAGQEEDRTLELELSAPVSRPQIYLERLAVLWVTVLVLTLALSAVLGALSVLLDLGLSALNLIAASTSLLLFGGTLGTVAFATGAATGRRATALAVAAAVAVTAYLLNYLGPLVEAPWMENLSPFHWYIGAQPLSTGFDWPGLTLLATLALITALAGLIVFTRRDLLV